MPRTLSKRQQSTAKVVLFIALLLPCAMMAYRTFFGTLADPAEYLIRATGENALRLLVLTLLITPLRLATRQTWLIHFRRMLGLYVFFYAFLHVQSYMLLDLQLDFSVLLDDIIKRKYITVGFIAFVLLIPLAITSNNALIKKMGAARWTRLHKAVYAIAILSTIHFLWQVKGNDYGEPLVYLAIFAVLLALRTPALRDKIKR